MYKIWQMNFQLSDIGCPESLIFKKLSKIPGYNTIKLPLKRFSEVVYLNDIVIATHWFSSNGII